MAGWTRAAALAKRSLPDSAFQRLRSVSTAFLAPYINASQSGFIRSSFARRAVDKSGKPLPWYSYPCIEALRLVDFSGRTVIEFGGGQSTLWWAERARSVVAFDEDEAWLRQIKPQLPAHAEMILVPGATDPQIAAIEARLGDLKADVVVIDGLDRIALIPVALAHLKPGGALLFDNANWGGILDAVAPHRLQRVDYYGPSPGVPLQHCTSLFFVDDCFALAAGRPLPG